MSSNMCNMWIEFCSYTSVGLTNYDLELKSDYFT